MANENSILGLFPEYDSEEANRIFTAPARAIGNFLSPTVERMQRGFALDFPNTPKAKPAVLPTETPPPAASGTPQPDLADQIAQARVDVGKMKGQLDRSMTPELARKDLGMEPGLFPPSAVKAMGPAPNAPTTVIDRPSWQPSDPTLQVLQGHRSPEERANYAPTLDAKLSAMFPGMSKNSRGTLTQQLYALVQPTTPAQAGAGPGFNQVASALAEKPTYKALSAGQTLYQIDRAGNAKQVVQAPGEPGAVMAHKDKETQQAMDMYKNVRNDYKKKWDKITEDFANDPVERAKALDLHNTQYFQSMGVPTELAEIPVSLKSFVNLAMERNKRPTLSAAEVKSLQQVHGQLVKQRNQMLKNFWGGKLNFGGYSEKSY